MTRFRLSSPAQADLLAILETSLERWGPQSRSRYAALLVTAMQTVAADPRGPTTRERKDLLPELRSFHVRHVPGHEVSAPVHVIYYRATKSGSIDVDRVLQERMEPAR